MIDVAGMGSCRQVCAERVVRFRCDPCCHPIAVHPPELISGLFRWILPFGDGNGLRKNLLVLLVVDDQVIFARSQLELAQRWAEALADAIMQRGVETRVRFSGFNVCSGSTSNFGGCLTAIECAMPALGQAMLFNVSA